MKILKTRFVLAVKDLKKSARYYKNVLGFNVYEIDDPGWRFAERDRCMLMLGECKDAMSPSKLGDHSYFAYIEVDNVDELYVEYLIKKAKIKHVPKEQPWGMREFALETIDGHRIMFGQKIR